MACLAILTDGAGFTFDSGWHVRMLLAYRLIGEGIKSSERVEIRITRDGLDLWPDEMCVSATRAFEILGVVGLFTDQTTPDRARAILAHEDCGCSEQDYPSGPHDQMVACRACGRKVFGYASAMQKEVFHAQ